MTRAPLSFALALALLTLAPVSGCRTDGEGNAGSVRAPPRATLELKRKVRNALARLPAEEGESFSSFLDRARAALSATDDPDTQSTAAFLPDEPALLLGGFAGEIGGVVLGAFARVRSREARVTTLRSLLTHQTINPPDVATPGDTPAFRAMENELEARAETLGLVFDHTDHVAWEIALPQHPKAKAQRVGVLVHADVVPAEEPGWTVPPFDGVLQDGRIYGRGALDDKGALVAALYALSALLDAGLPLLKVPVLIIGTSEESHWDGIQKYAATRGLPAELFVADGGFPVGVGEKGVATLRATSQATGAQPATAALHEATLRHIEAGAVSNQVPATATARLAVTQAATFDEVASRAAAMTGMNLKVAREGDELVVRATGTAAHGASPQDGHNALTDLVRFLSQRVRLAPTGCSQLLAALDHTLGRGFAGERLGLPDAHPRFSPSTINVGTVRTAEDGSCTVALNLRWPPPRSADAVVASVGDALKAAIKETSGGRFTVQVEGGGLDPFLVDDSAPWIARLTEAYAVVHGEMLKPITLSGTTYAKAAPGSVTFGPSGPDDHGRIHGADEHITTDELDELTELYTMSLLFLAGR